MLKVLSILMFIVPAALSLIIHMCLRHGEVQNMRKPVLYVLYVFVNNAITIAVSYFRGVKHIDISNMTPTYIYKYFGLACVVGFIVPFFVCLMTEDIITIGGFKRYAKKFFGDVKKYLPYAITSAKSDLSAEVASSYLNWMWWLIEPVCMMIIYTLIFGVVFKASEDYFAIFVFIGLTLWGFFARCITGSVDMVRANRDIVTKIYMPKYILLLAKMFVNTFKMMVSFVVIFIMMIAFRVPINFNILWIFPVFIVLFMFTFGVGCILMHYGVYVSDLGYITGILLQMLMYLTGVFYSIANQVPDPFGIILETFNPVAFLIATIRNALIYRTMPFIPGLVAWGVVSLVLIAIGVFTVYSNENSYVKVI